MTNWSFAQDLVLDYSQTLNWAVLPTDNVQHWADSLDQQAYPKIDVFYVYPTILLAARDKRWNYDVNDPDHRAQVEDPLLKLQASAWAGAGQVYVPYYRQAHIRAYSHLEGKGKEALYFAYSDVKAAFEYYLQHHNGGNGIILAGHSQGTTMLTLLIKEFFDGKELGDQLVAAYLPGIGIKKDEFESIKLMTTADEIGGFVSWNTAKRRYNRKQYRKYHRGSACINPITWDLTEVARKSQQKGFLYSNGVLYQNNFSTHLVDGAVWISRPKIPGRYRTLLMGSYHVGDVNLFWEDIRLNSRLRAKNYLDQID